MQRFGVGNVPSHHVGKAILQSDWKKVVELILSPKNRSDTKEALEYFQKTSDIAGTMKKIPRNAIENKILYGLEKNGKNAYLNAFSMLQRNMRTLYVHAYQSYVWNRVVSERVEKYGLEPIEGDLVLVSEQPIENDKDEENEDDLEDIDENDIDSRMKVQVKVLTKEDIDAKTYSITDVVLPLPGFEVEFPKNALAESYKEIMKEDNLDISLKHSMK